MGCALYMIVTRPFQMFNGKYEQTGGIIKYSRGVLLSVLTKNGVDLKSWSTNIQFVFLNLEHNLSSLPTCILMNTNLWNCKQFWPIMVRIFREKDWQPDTAVIKWF